MTLTTLNGYIARETDAAVAFLALDAALIEAKPFFIPRKKIASMVEGDTASVNVKLSGEGVERPATPYTIEVETAFLVRLGLA
jgi:hypothetical protein